MPQPVVMARWCAVIILAVGYTLLAHHTNTVPGNETLGSFVALTPILLAAFSIAWRSQQRTGMLALFATGCIALLAAWGTIEHHYSRIYWIEHAGTQFILCLAFARTLGRGREPMCTYFAGIVHGSLTPMLKRYTRHVTRHGSLFSP